MARPKPAAPRARRRPPVPASTAGRPGPKPDDGAADLAALEAIRARFAPDDARRKAALLRRLAGARPTDPEQLRRLHAESCFHRAFPASAAVARAAAALAREIGSKVAALPPARRAALDDTGIAGTATRNVLSATAARWVATRFPAHAAIDWPLLDSPEAMLPVLAPLLNPMEDEALQVSRPAFAAWLAQACEGTTAGDLAWLVRHAPVRGAAADAWDRAWDAAAVPVRWQMGGEADRGGAHVRPIRRGTAKAAAPRAAARRPSAAATLNRWPRPLAVRDAGLRRPSADPRAAVVTPLASVERLSRSDARALRDVWRAALLARTRTVYQAEHGNLDECWLADLGHGLALAAIGVPPRRRSLLEVNYGHLLLANGLPIGYGGFTALFRQINTGINVFAEYRGSEAAFAWEQALRAMHALTGCSRVIINDYQFGAGNDEALQSGAFWFYHRLGFRPVDPAVRALADVEAARLRDDRRYRVPIRTLRRLASGDLHLDLLEDAGRTFFEESWLGHIAEGITACIARERTADRPGALDRKAARLAEWLSIDRTRCSADERWGLAQLAPVLDQVEGLQRWPDAERRALGALCLARWAAVERPYVALARGADRLRGALGALARQRRGAGGD